MVGAVKTPGVVELPAESRVAEAIEAAGGASEKAQLAAINLARQLQDGEQLLVPTPEDIAAGRGAANNSAAGPGGSVPGGKININTATAEQLQTLPKVGPALAARIIDWRKTHGKFKNIDQLREVSGIGEKMFAGLKDKVTV
ncbi:MAG: ComEA family DNA-binding protein [Microbacteriaceae bacterium]|nr:ComEA family DNA-binding protein [Microbacteriaceae bacterium]